MKPPSPRHSRVAISAADRCLRVSASRPDLLAAALQARPAVPAQSQDAHAALRVLQPALPATRRHQADQGVRLQPRHLPVLVPHEEGLVRHRARHRRAARRQVPARSRRLVGGRGVAVPSPCRCTDVLRRESDSPKRGRRKTALIASGACFLSGCAGRMGGSSRSAEVYGRDGAARAGRRAACFVTRPRPPPRGSRCGTGGLPGTNGENSDMPRVLRASAPRLAQGRGENGFRPGADIRVFIGASRRRMWDGRRRRL